MQNTTLDKSTWKQIKSAKPELAILPWGATEAHNYHLPYATDTILAMHVATQSAKYAAEKGAKLIVLPAIPYGVNTGHADIKLNININPSTQLMILHDIMEVLNRQGILKLLVLNSHGGNDFKQIIRELGLKFPLMFISTCNYYQSVNERDFFELEGEHAGEMETSLMLHLEPDIVKPLATAGSGKAKKFRIQALNEKWAWAERKWSQVTNDTGIGNPSKATVQKGEACFNAIVEKVGNFMLDICNTDIGNLYE